MIVNSTFPDGTSGVQSIVFGGTSASTSTTNNSVDLTNQLSWFSANNKHRVKVTSEVRRDGYSLDQSTNPLGTFAFNSLTDLEANRPASFTRQLTPTRASGGEWIGGLSLGDSYRRTPTCRSSTARGSTPIGTSRSPALNSDVLRHVRRPERPRAQRRLR